MNAYTEESPLNTVRAWSSCWIEEKNQDQLAYPCPEKKYQIFLSNVAKRA